MERKEALGRLGLLVGEHVLDALASVKVAVFGVGGVGGWCAESLARSGVGRLMLVDFDDVCASNLNRQIMATSATIGSVVVEAGTLTIKDRTAVGSGVPVTVESGATLWLKIPGQGQSTATFPSRLPNMCQNS